MNKLSHALLILSLIGCQRADSVHPHRSAHTEASNERGSRQEVLAQEERGLELDRRLHRLSLINAKRDEIVREVVANRLTLQCAARRFYHLNQEAGFDLRCMDQGESEGERLCRQVINLARHVPATPAEKRAVVTRLEQELSELMKDGRAANLLEDVDP